MFDLLFITSIVCTAVQIVKEANAKPVPVENWANKELYHNDIMDGVSIEHRMKNLENGKYKLTETYPEPHRDPKSGKIMIENYKLYYEDVEKCGAYKAQQWAEQGRYNLSPDELKKEEERIKAKYEYLYSL
jgi:hypothetical protein